ncbi:MAG: hypothetical protein AAF998_05290 [Bacteroidota bacterium]
MRINGEGYQMPPGGERSYHTLGNKFSTLFAGLKTTWQSLPPLLRIIYLLHWLVTLPFFLVLSALHVFFWPLGSLRGKAAVGVLLGFSVPFFHLLISAGMCEEKTESLSIAITQNCAPVPGVRVLVEGVAEGYTDEAGIFSFDTQYYQSRMEWMGIDRMYCPACFEDHHFRVLLYGQDESQEPKRYIGTYNFGKIRYKIRRENETSFSFMEYCKHWGYEDKNLKFLDVIDLANL